MIGNIARNNNIFTYSRVQSRAQNNDNAFSEALETTENSAEDTLHASAPDKWVTEPGISFNAVKKALEYKKSLGIDDSEPTHELTAEQRDWLYSRHDLGSMQTYTSYSFVNDGGSTQYGVKATAEYSNFLADLAYLGVFSYDDLIQTSPLDTHPEGNSVLSGYVAEMQGSNYGLLDTARMSVEHLENMFSFYSERAMDPSRAVSGDSEFAELIRQRYLPYSQRFFEFVDELLGRDVEDVPQESVVPDIQDCSGKLAEDFGGIMG